MTHIELATATLADVPAADDWLSARERSVLATLKFEKRARDWRLGRWTAKRAAHRLFPVSELAIIAAPDGAPLLYVDGAQARATLSLSHSHGAALAVVSAADAPLGCDLEWIEPRTADFVQSYFTRAEQACVDGASAHDRDLIANAIWSAKEAVLKATRDGLRVDTRRVEIELACGEGWQPFRAAIGGTRYAGVWRASEGWIQAISY